MCGFSVKGAGYMPGSYVLEADGEELTFLVSTPHEEGGWSVATPDEIDQFAAAWLASRGSES